MTTQARTTRTRGTARRRVTGDDAGTIYRGLVRFFVVPGAVIAANWAALLSALTIVGLVPGLAGAGRALTDFEEHQDTSFRSVLRHVRTTRWRDLPVSIGAWMLICAIVLNGLLVTQLSPAARTFMVGLLAPFIWLLIAWVSAYVAVASDSGASRWELTLRAIRLCTTRPARALIAPAAVIALSPLWLLAPITLACGLSVPPYLLATLWRGCPGRAWSAEGTARGWQATAGADPAGALSGSRCRRWRTRRLPRARCR